MSSDGMKAQPFVVTAKIPEKVPGVFPNLDSHWRLRACLASSSNAT